MWRSTLFRLTAALSLVLSTTACGDEPAPATGGDGRDSAAVEAEAEADERSYERTFAFTGVERDTTMLVSVSFTSRTVPDGVIRRTRGWLGRAGVWEPFVDERWQTPPSRAAWRILPRGPVRLVVGESDAIESIIYRQPPRSLELDLGEGLVEWTGPRGGIFRLEEATLLLGTQQFSGVSLDLVRSRSGDEAPGGDWAFLVSDNSLQVVLQSPEESEPGAEEAWMAFVRVGFQQMRWPDVTMEWSESQAYDRARRNVPAAWRFSSRTEEIEGTLQAVSTHLSAGEGDGPVLPVSALFGVEGTVEIEGVEYSVRGLVRHRRE